MGGLWHCFTYISGFLLDVSMIFPSQTRRAALERGSRWGWAPPSTDSRPRCRKNLAATTFRVAAGSEMKWLVSTYGILLIFVYGIDINIIVYWHIPYIIDVNIELYIYIEYW